MLVAANGRRSVTDTLADGKMLDAIRFHNSGKIILAERKWREGDARPKIQLPRIDLNLGAEQLGGNEGGSQPAGG